MQKQESGKSNMSRKYRKLFGALLLAAAFITSANAQDARKNSPGPLVIQEQGSFAVGGTVITTPGTFDPIKQGAFNPAGPDPAGQTLRGDHAYVFYQVPANSRKLPLVFWHGHGQSGKTWETTPDGRGLPDHLPAPTLPGLRARPAAARPGGEEHAAAEPHRDARRADVVRDLPAGRVA